MDRLYRWRWRLARMLARVPIMEDPLAGREGAFVVVRKDGAIVTIKAAKFRLRTQNRLPKRASSFAVEDYGRSGRSGRFVGTVDYS